LRWCFLADSLRLLYSRDTLVDITVSVTDTSPAPWTVWQTRLTPRLLRLWGRPDSIDTGTVHRSPLGLGNVVFAIDNSWLGAYWRAGRRRAWKADLRGRDSLVNVTPQGPREVRRTTYGRYSISACGVAGMAPCR